MKRFVGMILGIAASFGPAHGGSIGGTGNGTTATYLVFPNSNSIRFPDRLENLDDVFVVARRGARAETDFKTYSLDSREFIRLQNVADSPATIEAKSESTPVKSYRVRSGNAENTVDLIDRRLEMRSCVAP